MNRLIFCLSGLFALLVFFSTEALSQDYFHSDTSVGPTTQNYFKFALVRGAGTRGGWGGGTSCIGAMGMLYHKMINPGTGLQDRLHSYICPNANPNWTDANCAQALVYSRSHTASTPEILAADLAITNYGKYLAAWVEVGGSPMKVSYKGAFSTDYGVTWGTPFELGSYELNPASGQAAPQDIDLAVNDSGQIGVLLSFDQNTNGGGTNHTILGNSTTAWFSLIVYDAALNPTVQTVFASGGQPAATWSPTVSTFADLVGGPGAFFHAFYATDGEYKVFTRSGDNYTEVRTIPDPLNAEGFYPRATRYSMGAMVRTKSGVYSISDYNYPASLVLADYEQDTLIGNGFGNTVVSPSIAFEEQKSVHMYTLNSSGATTGPTKINDSVGSLLCIDDTTNLGAQCNNFMESQTSGVAQKAVNEGPGAIVGNRYFAPSILRKRTWNGAAYEDLSEHIVISRTTLPFTPYCPVRPKSCYCFLAGTPILMADGSSKAIEDVQFGELVRSYSEKLGDFVVGKVTQSFANQSSSYYVINKELKVTGSHPIYVLNSEPAGFGRASHNSKAKRVSGKWTDAGDLKPGDLVLNYRGEPLAISTVDWVEESVPVYNLEVGPEHTFVAGGIVVHNKNYDPKKCYATQVNSNIPADF